MWQPSEGIQGVLIGAVLAIAGMLIGFWSGRRR
jgi:hypothetical protein